MSRWYSSLAMQRLGELVDVVRRHRVVEVRDPERLLDLGDALLGGGDGPLLLVDLVVRVAGEAADDRGELVVELRRVLRRARDDERRARLVDEDRVHLVDDRVDVAALDHVLAERAMLSRR